MRGFNLEIKLSSLGELKLGGASTNCAVSELVSCSALLFLGVGKVPGSKSLALFATLLFVLPAALGSSKTGLLLGGMAEGVRLKVILNLRRYTLCDISSTWGICWV